MALPVIITLSNMGSAVGPFNLYSDVDNYVIPFEQDVPASAFTYGYYTTSVPDGTLNIKVQSEGECLNYIITIVQNLPTPSVTPQNTPTNTPTITKTPTMTPTCGTLTTQYLKSEIQGNNSIKFSLFNDAGFTSNANAVCDYTYSGTYDIQGGAINQPYTTTQVTGDHTHSYNTGSNITGFTITAITYACGCVNVISNLITPTPSPTQTMTQTPSSTPPQPTPTQTTTPSGTPQVTPSQTGTNPGGQLYVYARYINTSQEFGYTLNGGSYLAIGTPASMSCDYVATISGLQVGDTIVFSTLLACSINGDTADCPNSTTGCSYTHNFVGTTYVYITVDASVCC